MSEDSDKLQECQICASRKKTVFPCPYCSYMSCIACNEHVILDSINPPACVSCKHEWSTDFLHSTFSRAFITKRYQKHREKVLFEREKALLPATQPHVAQARRRIEIDKQLLTVRRALNEARARVRELSRRETILRNNAMSDESTSEEKKEKISVGVKEYAQTPEGLATAAMVTRQNEKRAIDNEKKRKGEYILQEDDWYVDIPDLDSDGTENIRW